MGISLRLDDGSVIRASGAGTTVVAADAQESNLSDAHITKLENLLVKMHALVPEAGPLRTVPTEQSPFGTSLKRMFDAEQQEHHPGKRPRTNGHANGQNGFGYDASGAVNFEIKCHEMLDRMTQELGKDAWIFSNPVDGAQVPGYYTMIKHPMDLGTIRTKLSTHVYSSAQEFYEDVHQVWVNCFAFNGKKEGVGRIGDRISGLFEEMWAGSGFALSTARSKRNTAGIAAERFEPMGEEAQQQRAHPSGGGPRRSHSRMSRDQMSPRAINRTKSTLSHIAPLPQDKAEYVAAELPNLGDRIEAALAIIQKKHELQTNADGELELDFGSLDAGTMWELYEFISGESRLGAGTPVDAGFQLEQESDDDTGSDDD